MVSGEQPDSGHIDRALDLLRSEYRRRIIYVLQRRGPSSVDELADELTGAAGPADDRQRAVASLVHTHLPKLSDAEVVEYDGTEEPVSLARGVETLEPFLSVAARQEADGDLPEVAGHAAATDGVTGSAPD